MAAKKYRVGKEIDAWCTKCKVDRLHVIETLKSDGNINRVMCRTCESIHLFRRPKGEEGADGKKTAAPRKRKPEHVVSEAEAAKAKAYAMDGEFAVGDAVRHAKFGLGKVTVLKPAGKMEVAFDEGVKVLLCKDTGSLLLKRGRAAAAARTAAALGVAKAAAAKAAEEAAAEEDDEGNDDVEKGADDPAAVVIDAEDSDDDAVDSEEE